VPTLADPIAFDLLGFTVRWYALFILLGIGSSLAISHSVAGRLGRDSGFLLDIAPWVVLAAIVGARLYYVLLKGGHYVDHPGDIVNVRLGGLTIHGALAAGVAMFWWLCRRAGQPFLVWGDIAIAGVPFGQAIGRWGNWANQEAFGRPSDLPWAVTIASDRRPLEYVENATFHPTFLYEGLLDFAIGVMLVWLVLRIPTDPRFRNGDAICMYLVLYGMARLAIESMRTDSLHIGPLPAAYWLSSATIAIGAGVAIGRRLAAPGDRPRNTPSMGEGRDELAVE
jgi:prolipoprotein diacylglyceryl transferase